MGVIAFGSQRASEADLGRHLLNAEDNEYVEVKEIRGAVADDVPGALSEFAVHAHTMTRCEKFLYSLSVNPDPAQGPFTHDQYMDYIERAEDRLGLHGQPRVIVAHIKENKLGELREHYHCVWSRIDVAECKAIPISFDRSKLMMVSREFAHDHSLSLPDGYHTGKAKAQQLSLYDKAQMDQTGLTRQERIDIITDLWRASDSAKAFVAGLEEHGYMLANGRRPYVLVDVYGHTNALPRMIDDNTVRQKDVLAYLEQDYPPESLPDVDEAKKLAAQHYAERKDMRRNEEQAEQLAILKRSQDKRAEELQGKIASQKERHDQQREALVLEQSQALEALKKRHAGQDLQISFARTQNAPKGIAGFFAKYTGISFVRTQLHRREDRLRENCQALEREKLAQEQREKTDQQTRLHHLQMIELRRKEKAQGLVFAREQRTLARKHEQQRAMAYRKGHEHMPALALNLTPGGRRAVPHKAARRFTSPTAKELNAKARPRQEHEPVELGHEFAVAAQPPKKRTSGSSKSPGAEFRVHDKDRDGGKKR